MSGRSNQPRFEIPYTGLVLDFGLVTTTVIVVWPRPMSPAQSAPRKCGQAPRDSFIQAFCRDLGGMFDTLDVAADDSASPKRRMSLVVLDRYVAKPIDHRGLSRGNLDPFGAVELNLPVEFFR